MSPASPTISPARRVSVASTTPGAVRPATSRTTGESAGGRRFSGYARLAGRPSIPVTRLASVSSDVRPVRTTRPSRRTVTASDRSSTSVRKCDTRMTVRPRDRSARTIWCNRSTSTVDRLADGSSRTIRSASRASARRISTCCCAASGRCPTTDPARRSKPASATSRSNRSLSDPRSMKPARFGSAPRKTFSATVSLGTRATSWATSAIPRMSAWRGEPNETVVPRRTRSP